MADDYVRRMLDHWKLGQLIPVFEENEIDEEAFKVLTEDSIKVLIPKVGPQAKFLGKWSKTCGKESVDKPIARAPDFTDPVIILDEIITPADALSGEIGKVIAEVPLEVPVAVPAGEVPVQVACSESSSRYSSTSEKSGCLNQTNSDVHTCEDLEALLASSVEGLVVLNTYSHKKEFDNRMRINLAHAIISHEVVKSKDYKISSQRLLELAQLIQKTFPPERADTYYIPFETNSVTNKRSLAKGKLYDKYCASRTFLIQSGAISPKKRRTDRNHPFVLGFRENLRSIEDSEGCIEKLEWLKNCLEPWTMVELYWRETSKTRLETLLTSDSITSIEYIQSYKVLQQPCGYNLRHIDFSVMYPEKSITLYAGWSKFEKNVIEFAKDKKKKDPAVKALLSIISELNENAENDTSGSSAQARAAVVLRILPLLLPCPQVKNKNKPLWRVSKSELQNSFFLHITSITELESELAVRRRKLSSHGLPEQPLPVFVAPSLKQIEASYVCINDIKYRVDSPLAALDTTLKSFYALQLQYPREAEPPWLVIQNYLYKISGEEDRVLPSVVTLIGDLERYTSAG